jgi:hypothetical protein
MPPSLTANQKVIGRYTILRELRRDRHSVSYAAVDPVMNRELVVKAVQIVPAGPPIKAEARRLIEQAFVRQAQAAGRLHHPNIVTVFDAGLGHEFGYLVIERVAGRPLQELLASGAQFSDLQCAGIGARVSDALEYAHTQGVAHGDLGPQHVLIQADGSPKVTGFGGWIDGGAGGDAELSRTGELLPFFQNEISEDTRKRDVRSLISLLCTLIQGRTHAVDVALPASPGLGPVPLERPGMPTTFSRLLSDMLDPQSPSAPKTAAALRDALIAFVWAERANRQGTSALGVTLSASLSATLPRDGPAAEAAAPVPAERPDLLQLALERADEALGAVRRRLEKIGPWARQNRVVLTLAATLLIGGLALGNLLVQFRARPSATTAPPSAPASTSASDAADASAAGPASAPGAAAGKASTTVTLRVIPWGEIIVDNKPTGVSPPMQQIALSMGKHTIEVRHLDDQPCVQTIEVKAEAAPAPDPVTCEFR